MTEPEMTLAEERALLGEDAWLAAEEIAAAAPPFGPLLEARLAVLLRRDLPADVAHSQVA